MKRFLVLASAAALAFAAGCATVAVEKIPPQESFYPAEPAPDAPLVIAVPGLRIPGLPVSQDQHFGHLVRMLTEEGIPCRIVPYDTKEHPLARGAALFSPSLAIAWTRVGPSVVRELERENERRAARGMPPVRRLVLFGYSQGGVIVEQLAFRLFYEFRNNYRDFAEELGGEWEALKKDPEFTGFIDALDDFLVIKNIKIQREGDFESNPDLKHFYERAERRMEKRFEDLVLYLADPASKYPGIVKFETPESPFYPKRYGKARRWALSLRKSTPERRDRMKRFFVDYAEYRNLLPVEPAFITASGSFFGSPRANEGYALLRLLPFLKRVFGGQFMQIAQTRLGTPAQGEQVARLARLSKDRRYPIDSDSTLFIIGANGVRGDGLVDQSSAHLGDHSYTVVEARKNPGAPGGWEAATVEHERLPDLRVAPVEAMHFPEKILWGLLGKRFGTAYMAGDAPSYPYLLKFVRGDDEGLREALEKNGISLRQFMLEVSFAGAKMGRNAARRTGVSRNVKIDGRYYNDSSGTVVWTGHFTGRDQEMNLAAAEDDAGEVRLRVRLPGGGALPLACGVFPGCNSIVRIKSL